MMKLNWTLEFQGKKSTLMKFKWNQYGTIWHPIQLDPINPWFLQQRYVTPRLSRIPGGMLHVELPLLSANAPRASWRWAYSKRNFSDIFWFSIGKTRQWNSLRWKGSTLANSTPAILEVCIVRFGKALFNCSMHRNLCDDTSSHGCRVHLKSKKACPIKVICHMASLFVGLMNQHRSSLHPYSAVRLELAEPKVSRTMGSASNLKGLEAGMEI